MVLNGASVQAFKVRSLSRNNLEHSCWVLVLLFRWAYDITYFDGHPEKVKTNSSTSWLVVALLTHTLSSSLGWWDYLITMKQYLVFQTNIIWLFNIHLLFKCCTFTHNRHFNVLKVPLVCLTFNYFLTIYLWKY
jgi:hypothetical protein